jgi:hypothetical protein
VQRLAPAQPPRVRELLGRRERLASEFSRHRQSPESDFY